jgi:hypothetical protein
VVVVVGGVVVVVVVVVVRGVVSAVLVGDSVLGDDVVGVVVEVDVDVDGTEVVVEGTEVEVLLAVLEPGCSLATTTPMSAVAPVAARKDARVSRRNLLVARCLVSGVKLSLACFMADALLLARTHLRSRASRLPQPFLWALCEMIGPGAPRRGAKWHRHGAVPTGRAIENLWPSLDPME